MKSDIRIALTKAHSSEMEVCTKSPKFAWPGFRLMAIVALIGWLVSTPAAGRAHQAAVVASVLASACDLASSPQAVLSIVPADLAWPHRKLSRPGCLLSRPGVPEERARSCGQGRLAGGFLSEDVAVALSRIARGYRFTECAGRWFVLACRSGSKTTVHISRGPGYIRNKLAASQIGSLRSGSIPRT